MQGLTAPHVAASEYNFHAGPKFESLFESRDESGTWYKQLFALVKAEAEVEVWSGRIRLTPHTTIVLTSILRTSPCARRITVKGQISRSIMSSLGLAFVESIFRFLIAWRKDLGHTFVVVLPQVEVLEYYDSAELA